VRKKRYVCYQPLIIPGRAGFSLPRLGFHRSGSLLDRIRLLTFCIKNYAGKGIAFFKTRRNNSMELAEE
jgi:hypothetical protein